MCFEKMDGSDEYHNDRTSANKDAVRFVGMRNLSIRRTRIDSVHAEICYAYVVKDNES